MPHACARTLAPMDIGALPSPTTVVGVVFFLCDIVRGDTRGQASDEDRTFRELARPFLIIEFSDVMLHAMKVDTD